MFAADFLGKGYDQIFYAASTGGSGGFGYYYVIDFSHGADIIFDYSAIENPYTAAYADGFLLNVVTYLYGHYLQKGRNGHE